MSPCQLVDEWCVLFLFFAGKLGFLKADYYRFRKQNMIFQHFGRLFLPGTLKNVNAPLL